MQNFRLGSMAKTCLTLLSLSLLTQTAFGYEGNRVSYLDSVSSSYLYNQSSDTRSIMNINSADARGMEASFKLGSTPIITESNAKINLSLRDSDIRQALRMLADKAKLNIVFDESVNGKITLDLNNISINDAFMVIFKSSQLAYTMDGNCITVMTLEAFKEIGYTRQNMTVIPIKYVNAESIADFLNKNIFKSSIFGLSSRPVVTANPRTNQIIVFGSNADVTAIKRILPVIDTKPLINSFTVNHTTPKEMATLICDSLFYKSGSDDDTKSEENSSNSDEDGELTISGGVVACRDYSDDFTEDIDDEDYLSSLKTTPLTVTYFPELGQIGTSGGSVEQVEVIRDFIKEHDKKQLMAYIELSIIELNETGSKDFQNTWDLWTPFVNLGFNTVTGLTVGAGTDKAPFFLWGNHYPTTVTTTNEVKNEDGSVTYETITEQSVVSKTNNKALTYRLTYLVENGNGRVLTNPKIMVTNGKKAVIDMTSDYIKSTTTQYMEMSSLSSVPSNKTYEIGNDNGLLVELTPFISPDGYVSLNLTPEFATIKHQQPGTDGDIAYTLLQRRDLELKNIRIRDGETLVLAGLIKETEVQATQKMPILSDLPIVGAFFRGSRSNKEKEELVIVITPHIVKDNDSAPTNEKIYDL